MVGSSSICGLFGVCWGIVKSETLDRARFRRGEGKAGAIFGLKDMATAIVDGGWQGRRRHQIATPQI